MLYRAARDPIHRYVPHSTPIREVEGATRHGIRGRRLDDVITAPETHVLRVPAHLEDGTRGEWGSRAERACEEAIQRGTSSPRGGQRRSERFEILVAEPDQ